MPDKKRPGHGGHGDVPRTARIHRRLTKDNTPAEDFELFSEAETLDKAPPSPPQDVSPAPQRQRMEPASFLDDTPPPSTEPLAQSVDALAELLSEDDGDFDSGIPPVKKTFPPPLKQGKKEKPYKQPRPKGKRRLRDIISLKRVLISLLLLIFIGAVCLGFFFVHTTRNDHLWLDLETIPHRTESLLYYTDENGQQQIYASLPCTQNKEYVDGSEIPQLLRDAFVATEDHKFYSHFGMDVKRTIFAAANEVIHKVTGTYIGGRKQGASTITQQLIKNLTRDDADSNMSGYMRKLREVCRAVRLDAVYTKDEIMDAYLNIISFTGNTAGVQAEAKKLFGKPVSELTLPECASLAAITRNPSRYNPVTNPEEHKERRDFVLSEMLDMAFITQAQHDEAVATPVQTTGTPEPKLPDYVTSYFTDTVIDSVITELAARFNLTRQEASNLLYNGGLRIYTTVNPALQNSMEQAMVKSTYHPLTTATATKQLVDADGAPMVDEDGKPVFGPVQVTPQAAMVSLDYHGGIAAVVGGLGEKEINRGFNRATQAVRQVGSTMKPIGPYATALEDNKITWSTPFLDAAVMKVEDEITGQMVDWPSNVDKRYSNHDILVREGISRSVNTVAVRVGQAAGVTRMYNFVTKDLGISSFTKDDRDLGPLVLGSSTYGITPLEMAMAYAMFGNGGYAVTPHSYTKVTSGTNMLYYEMDSTRTQVIGADTAFIMNRLLRTVMTDGTSAGWSVPGDMDSVGKTGTTSDNRDHWFIGLTPYYVTSSWYGYDENMPLAASNRNHPPTLAWRAVMQTGQQGLAYREFPQSSEITQLSYCAQSGAVAASNCPAATGWYKTNVGPRDVCQLHR